MQEVKQSGITQLEKDQINQALKYLPFRKIRSMLDDGMSIAEICEVANIEAYKKRPELNRWAFDLWLQENEITLRKNAITRKIEINGMQFNDRETEQAYHDLIIFDDVRKEYKTTLQLVQKFIGYTASENTYNPIVERLDAIEWDGIERFSLLFSALGVTDELSKTLIHKWFMQCIALQYNTIEHSFGADGVLVLQGNQGIGKTRFVSLLMDDSRLVKLGQAYNPNVKDTLIACTSCFICELGEIEKTLRSSDAESFKAFITQDIDEIRLPYAAEATQTARHSSFIGTANTTDFITDTTGSRRFWVVEISNVDFNQLETIDMLQIWKQAQEETKKNLQAFRLTDEEREQLQARNTKHERALPAQEEIQDILSEALNHPERFITQLQTVTEFQAHYEALKKYNSRQIGKALERCGVVVEKNSNRGSLRPLPIRNTLYFER